MPPNPKSSSANQQQQVTIDKSTAIQDSRSKAQKVKGEVDEVVDIMSQNIKKVVERGENLQDLEAKTDSLQASSKSFKTSAKKVKRKMWWKNTKWTLIISFILLGMLTLIICYFTGVFERN